MSTDPNAWIFEDSGPVAANSDPNAWIFEDEPPRAPEPQNPEPTMWDNVGQALKSGMSTVGAFSPVMGLAAEIVSPEKPDDTIGAAALRGIGQGGLAVGQAASGLATSLPGAMLKSHPVDKIREMTAPYATDQVDKTWQGMPRPQGDDALSEAVTKFAGDVGEGTADLLRWPVADKLLEIGKENAGEYERWGKEIQATVPEYRRGKDFIHNPGLLLNPEYMIEGGISAAVSMVPPILAAMGTGGSALVAGTVGGMMEGLPFLQDLLDKGVMPEEALVRSGSYAASSAALNAFSFGKMLDVGVMDALKVRGAKIIAAAGWEGFTEWLEGPVQALAEHVGNIPMVKQDSTLGADAMQGLEKAFKDSPPESLVEALTKAGREEAPVIPGAVISGGGMSSVTQLSAPEPAASAAPPAAKPAPVPPAPSAPLEEFGFDLLRAGDDPALDRKRQGLMNALTGLQAQGLAQEAIPTTQAQQVIEGQVGLSRPPARPEGYYEQPVLAPEQLQEFEQGLSAQPGPVETYPVEDLEAEWQARKADQDAMNEQARLEAEWKARSGQNVQAPAIQNDIDQKAHEAATSPLNDLPEPTQAQKEAGVYKKGHVFVNGLDISIENPAGSTRSGRDEQGNEWSTEMQNHYGYIKGTQGADKDHVDVFLGPDPKGAPSVFVVDQVNPETGAFDEHKAMIGFENGDQAREAYLSNYEEGWRGMGAITEMPFAEFKEWARSKKTKKPVGDISRQQLSPAPDPAVAPPSAVDEGAISAPVADQPLATSPVVDQNQQNLTDKPADRPSAETVMAPVQAEASAKEPWQMTGAEYASAAGKAYVQKRGGSAPAKAVDVVTGSAKKRHERLVKQAAAEGKQIPGEVLAEYPDIKPQPDATIKPQRGKKALVKKTVAERNAALADYFAPGNIVKGYGGHDRVVSFSPADGTGAGWNVTVQAVKRDEAGNWVDDGAARQRTHATMPSGRELKARPVRLSQSKPDQEPMATGTQEKPRKKLVKKAAAQVVGQQTAGKTESRADEGASYQTKPQTQIKQIRPYLPTLKGIREAFHWADSITEDGDGRTVVTKGKNSFAVTKVEQITPDEVSFRIQYKRAFDPKTDKIAGDYRGGEIRLSLVADKWTLMHEYEHALEDMGLINKMEQAILDAAAKKAGYDMAPSENRAYYVQDQLEKREFDRKTPAGRILQKIADMVDSFANLFARTARGIVRDVESGKVMEREEGNTDSAADSQYALSGLPSRVKAELQPKLDYLRMKFQDKFLPLLRVQEKLVRDGWMMTEEANAYRAEELFSGKAGQRLEKFQKDMVGRLLENMKDLGVPLAELEDYLYAKYAPQRNAYIATINPDMPDGGSGHTNQWAADKLNEFNLAGKMRKLEALAKVVRSIAQMQRDIIRNEGLEADETIDAWEAANPDYVPLKGGKEEAHRTIGTGFNIKRSGTKRALGRKSPATDILAHLFAQVGDTIIRAEKAKVGRAFLKMAEQNPDAELWRVHDHLPTKRGMVKKTNMARLRQKESSLKKLLALKSIKSNTRAAATRHLADVQAAIAAGGTKKVGNVVDMSFPMKDNVLTVTREDGSVRYVELFDDDLARVMKNLTPGQHGRVVQAMATFTRFLSVVNTSLNPEFVVTNFERDLLTALVHLSGEQRTAIAKKVVKDIPSAMRGIYNYLRGDGSKDWAVWYDMFKDAGAHVSFMDLRGIDQIKKDIEAMANGKSKGKLASGKAAARRLLDFIGDVNTTVENAVRLSTFKNLIESGTSESDAASIAKNLTVNFNRKGELGPAMNALYMFFNAGVQGSARILFALGNRRVQKIMAAVTLLAFGLAELNVLMGGDDDDDEAKWDKHASEWIKQTNLIIMLPSGDSVKIRMPYGYNFFVALGYALSDVRRWAMNDGGKNPAEAATFLFKAAMNAFNPMGDDSLLQMLSPTVLDPFVQIATNENFMGTEIAPEQAPFGPEKPNSQLYFRSVSKPSKAVAEFINSVTGGDKWTPGAVDWSPEWIDHIVSFLTGGLGRTIRDTASLPAVLADPDRSVRQIPFLRQVYQERNDRADMNRFYENAEKIDKAHAMLKELPLPNKKAFVDEHPELKLRKRAEGLKRRLSALRKVMYRHQDAGDKAKALEVEETMRKLVLNFNKKYSKVE